MNKKDSALKNILGVYNGAIMEIAEREGLRDINPNSNVQINGKNTLQFFTDITRLNLPTDKSFNDFFFFGDLLKKSFDLRYLVASVYAHRPFLWDFDHGAISIDNELTYTYHPSFHDTRYLMYCDLAFQTLYNYWDKIGDLLAIFLLNSTDREKIYFGSVVNTLSKKHQNSKNCKWLQSFNKNQFKDLNVRRRDIVHYSSYSTSVREKWFKGMKSSDEMEVLINEINDMPEYFKIHTQFALEGFEKSLLLIEEVERTK